MKLRALPLLLTCAMAASIVGATGCVVRERAEPVEYAEVDPGVDVTVYPHEYYEGRTVYWVNNRWYYRDGHRWRYYREEPVELHRRRVVVVPDRDGDRDRGRDHDRGHDRDHDHDHDRR